MLKEAAGVVGFPNEQVVMLHGIARTSRSMQTFAGYLKDQGYCVLNVGYPSTRLALESLVEHVQQKIEKSNLDPVKKTHFVGYSMGGLLARGVIHRFRPPNLGRVVQVAPPNQGSEVADFWKNFFLYQWIFGPAGKELGAKEKEFARILGPVDYELGVVAGNRTWDPISSAIIPGPDDGKVSVENTRVEGMQDHIVVRATHTFIIYNQEVFRQTHHFLQHGRFDRNPVL